MRALFSILAILIPSLASADDGVAPTPARLLHVPPGEVEADEPLVLTAAIDGAWQERDLSARWRTIGSTAWQVAPFRASTEGGWYARIPGRGVGRRGVEYYIPGDHAMHFASADAPHRVAVVPSAIDQLAERDLARHAGRRDEVGFEITGQDFGNRFAALEDHHVRAEARWTHRHYRALYATTFGFGGIEGTTPARSDPAAEQLAREARYGFGEVRFRVHPAVFLDARATLGISHAGFLGGAGAAITLGRPWATSVSFGGEYLGDLAAAGFFRLQWDTAPPFLMGATLVQTTLPGATRSASLVRYDVAYRLRDRVTLRAAVSFGARDGGGRFGGAFGLAYEL